jgi:hypothetical protein
LAACGIRFPIKELPSMRPNKPAMRLAVAIHKQLVCHDSTSVVCDLPEASWQQCQVLSRRVQRAQQRGWRLAARRCERDFRAVIGFLEVQCHGLQLQGIAVSEVLGEALSAL